MHHDLARGIVGITAAGAAMRLRKPILICLSLPLLFCRGASNLPALLAPDLVLHNGKIVTFDKDFSVAQPAAIKKGRFVAVGSDRDVLPLAASRARKIDLQGKTVLPDPRQPVDYFRPFRISFLQ